MGVHLGAEPEDIRAELGRIIGSRTFSSSARLSRLLSHTVEETLAGRGDRIKEYSLALEVFDRGESFDPKIDPIVRMYAGKLRDRLRQYYEQEGSGGPLRIELPKGSYVPGFRVTATNGAPFHSAAASRRRSWLFVAGAVLFLGAAAAWWRATTRESRLPPELSQITADASYSDQPDISRDGQYVAYVSDASGRAQIWLRRGFTGQPLELTHGTEEKEAPNFSPDVTRLAYNLQAPPGGIYLVSVLGGEPRRLTDFGSHPRFSPDGAWVMFVHAGEVWAAPASGGAPQRLRWEPELVPTALPIWLDSHRLLVTGYAKANGGRNQDWWVAAFPAGRASATGAFDKLRRRLSEQAMRKLPFANALVRGYLYFAAHTGSNSANLWRMKVRAGNLRPVSDPDQITFGPGQQKDARVIDDGSGGARIVFTSQMPRSDAWALPLDSASGKVMGEPYRVTRHASLDVPSYLSSNGVLQLFCSRKSGHYDVWIKNLKTGEEKVLVGGGNETHAAAISGDGTNALYTDFEGQRAVFYIVPTTGRSKLRICDDCIVHSLNRDGQRTLEQKGSVVVLHDLVSGQRTPVARANRRLDRGIQLSRDERWMLASAADGVVHHIYVAPLRPLQSSTDAGWIPIAEAMSDVCNPRWSPDGYSVYFASRDPEGLRIWRQRLDRVARRPAGSPEPVALLRKRIISPLHLEFSIATDKLVYLVTEATSQIWTTVAR
jgi:Tol biopolymer transport system component